MMTGVTWAVCMNAPVWTGELGVGAPELFAQAPSNHPAHWVKEVAKEFRKERYKKILARSPFGSPERSILYVLHHAAKELHEGHTASARELIGFALDILDDGVKSGWYSASDIVALRNVIVTRARDAIQEAGIVQRDDGPPSHAPH